MFKDGLKTKEYSNLYNFDMARVAMLVPEVCPGKPIENVSNIKQIIEEALSQNAAIFLLPELSLSGYSLDDLFLQSSLYHMIEDAIEELLLFSVEINGLIVVGCPVIWNGRLLNCALAINRGKILGAVPKTYLPNYREFYEKRQFSSASICAPQAEVLISGQSVPLSASLIFKCSSIPDLQVGIEICEDLWAPVPPSSTLALDGATCILNLSASNASLEKEDERLYLVNSQSSRLNLAYCYVAAGTGESTTDLAWDGHAIASELGVVIAENERFQDRSILFADIDIERIRNERLRNTTFGDSLLSHRSQAKTVSFEFDKPENDVPLMRYVECMPFVPNELGKRSQYCNDAFNIQVQGLQKRLASAKINKVVLGVSGGLDSSHALLVAAKTFDKLKLPRSQILAFGFPGFATSDQTKNNAKSLCEILEVSFSEIDILPSCLQTMEDIGYQILEGKYDVTYENVQAGARTSTLFRLANYNNALVVGTGDLSESALGWCTYGVGDHMSHYNPNVSLPKTLLRYTMEWVATNNVFGERCSKVLKSVLSTPISPELIPHEEEGAVQETEKIIGPYILQDFNLYHTLRYGLTPGKICFLCFNAHKQLWCGPQFAGSDGNVSQEFSLDEILHWMEVFQDRFFHMSQFKRSAMPNGPKITSGGSLSPRGEWRMPSDF